MLIVIVIIVGIGVSTPPPPQLKHTTPSFLPTSPPWSANLIWTKFLKSIPPLLVTTTIFIPNSLRKQIWKWQILKNRWPFLRMISNSLSFADYYKNWFCHEIAVLYEPYIFRIISWILSNKKILTFLVSAAQ